VEEVQSGASGDEGLGGVLGGRVGDYFLEDGAEEDERRREAAGASDLGERVAGEADDRVRETGRSVELADLGWREFAFGGGEVDAVGADGDGDVGAGVDEKFGAGAVDFREDAKDGPSGFGEIARREVFLAELEEIDAFDGTLTSMIQQGCASGGLGPGEAQTIGNGVAEHLSSVGRRNGCLT